MNLSDEGGGVKEIKLKAGAETEEEERFACDVCGKSYLRKRHLQRHMRDECIDIPPRFSCDLCTSQFRRKYHMVRHLTSKHGIPPDIAQHASSSTGQRNSSNTSSNGQRNTTLITSTGGQRRSCPTANNQRRLSTCNSTSSVTSLSALNTLAAASGIYNKRTKSIAQSMSSISPSSCKSTATSISSVTSVANSIRKGFSNDKRLSVNTNVGKEPSQNESAAYLNDSNDKSKDKNNEIDMDKNKDVNDRISCQEVFNNHEEAVLGVTYNVASINSSAMNSSSNNDDGCYGNISLIPENLSMRKDPLYYIKNENSSSNCSEMSSSPPLTTTSRGNRLLRTTLRTTRARARAKEELAMNCSSNGYGVNAIKTDCSNSNATSASGLSTTISAISAAAVAAANADKNDAKIILEAAAAAMAGSGIRGLSHNISSDGGGDGLLSPSHGLDLAVNGAATNDIVNGYAGNIKVEPNSGILSTLPTMMSMNPGETVAEAAAAAVAAANMMDDEWKMKFSLQLISNSLLKDRFVTSMPSFVAPTASTFDSINHHNNH